MCNNTGFKGRIALYEVMTVNDPIKELVLMGASGSEIKKESINQGMKTLRQSGLTAAGLLRLPGRATTLKTPSISFTCNTAVESMTSSKV